MALPCLHRYAGDKTHAARLLTVLGPEKFAALQKAFGGRRIWVPKKGKQLTCGLCRRREECVFGWRASGRPIARIAEQLSISTKSVYRILASRKGRRA